MNRRNDQFYWKGSTSFCEQKEAKKLFYSWPVARETVSFRLKKFFAPLFSKKSG
jgi:hypothetical protein